MVGIEERQRLVRPGVERADHDLAAGHRLEDTGIEHDLLRDGRRVLAIEIQELRAKEADTFRKLLPFVIGVGVFSAAIAWVDLEWLKLGDDSRVKNLPLMHSLLGVVIGLLLVFRTNTAYDRWWDAASSGARW